MIFISTFVRCIYNFVIVKVTYIETLYVHANKFFCYIILTPNSRFAITKHTLRNVNALFLMMSFFFLHKFLHLPSSSVPVLYFCSFFFQNSSRSFYVWYVVVVLSWQHKNSYLCLRRKTLILCLGYFVLWLRRSLAYLLTEYKTFSNFPSKLSSPLF